MGSGTLAALQLLFGVIDRAEKIKTLLATAQAEKRDVTDAELDQLAVEDDAARRALEEAIAKRKAG